MRCLLRHQITCHSPLSPGYYNNAANVAGTTEERPSCLNTWCWSMEPAVPQQYCKTDTLPSLWNAEEPAVQSATSHSRQWSGVTSTWRVVEGWSSAETRTCKCWGRVCEGIHVDAGWDQCGVQSTRGRERVHPCNFCDKDFKCLPTTKKHNLWQHIGNVFVCKDFDDIILKFNVRGEEEMKRTVLAQEEGQHPLQFQFEMFCVGF